jgi:hypothetical protein
VTWRDTYQEKGSLAAGRQEKAAKWEMVEEECQRKKAFGPNEGLPSSTFALATWSMSVPSFVPTSKPDELRRIAMGLE